MLQKYHKCLIFTTKMQILPAKVMVFMKMTKNITKKSAYFLKL